MNVPRTSRRITLVGAAFDGLQATLLWRTPCTRAVTVTLDASDQDGDEPKPRVGLSGSAELRKAVEQEQLGGADVASALPPDQVRYRRMLLAPMPENEWNSAVRWELAKDHGVASEELCVGCHRLGEVMEQGKRRIEVIAVSALATDVSAHAALLRQAGLNPVSIEPWAGAVARCFAGFSLGGGGPQPCFVVGVGRRSCTCAVVNDGSLQFVRHIDICGRHAHETARVDMIARLVQVVKECVQYLADAPAAQRPHVGCVLTTPDEERDIVEALSQATDLEFRTVSELLPALLKETGTNSAVRAELGKGLAAVGLMMRCDSGKGSVTPVDFLSHVDHSELPAPRRFGGRRLLVGIAACATVWSFVAWLHIQSLDRKINVAREEVRALQRQTQILGGLTSELGDQIRLINWLKEPTPVAAVLALTGQVVPEEAVIDEFTLSIRPPPTTDAPARTSATIIAKGRMPSDALLEQMARNIQRAGVFRDVTLKDDRARAKAAPQARGFELSMVMPLQECGK